MAPYIAVQLLGATAAAAICRMIVPIEAINQAQLGIPLPAAWVSAYENVLLKE